MSSVESIMERSKAVEMTEVPKRPNEDTRAIVQFFEAGTYSHFSVNVDRKDVIGNNCGINVDPGSVEHCVAVGTKTDPILKSSIKHFVDVGKQMEPPGERIMVSER